MSKNVFNSVLVRKPQTSTFDLGHSHLLTTQMGILTPSLLLECYPGDKWKISTETFIRFAPLVAPVMHKINVFQHYFFVPNRIIWPNWDKFWTGNDGKPNPPSPPYIRYSGPDFNHTFATSSLGDYYGLPTGTPVNLEEAKISALPFAGYQAIYNEYYRDQNLVAAVPYALTDGVIGNSASVVMTTLRKRAWMHDYFTASLPFAQKGAAVTIPLNAQSYVPVKRHTAAVSPPPTAAWGNTSPASTQTHVSNSPDGGAGIEGQLFVDGSDIVGQSTINDLRRAYRLQEFLEKIARGGSRAVESLLVRFGVRSPDARLDRPEFLGGSIQPVIISEVLQTSETDGTPLASMGGHAISASSGKLIRYTCLEHGYIHGIMSIMPLTTYQQGIHRSWSRRTYLDYMDPTFAHIGEQEVLNKELYVDSVWDSTSLGNNGTFGYVPRYSELRYMNNRVSGEFKGSLAFWTLSRIFSARPALNQTFIECTPRTDIFAVSAANNQNLWCHIHHRILVNRRLPKYGTPTL